MAFLLLALVSAWADKLPSPQETFARKLCKKTLQENNGFRHLGSKLLIALPYFCPFQVLRNVGTAREKLEERSAWVSESRAAMTLL